MTKNDKIALWAQKCYDDANCTYGNNEGYEKHTNMVCAALIEFQKVFINIDDFNVTLNAAPCHDLIEDAKQTYNNICSIADKDVADIVLAVTDVPAENRLMKHLLTMGKTVKDYRAIILKMCDILANAIFSKSSGSSMYKKYVEEYQYRKPIFQKALGWYCNYLNQEELQKLWIALDEVHENINLK
jgi:(p)ppGpp synthase/HD superfamily hydrolase